MAYQRIRKFNTKDAWQGQGLDNDLAMAVRAGNRVFLRGQVGMDLDGNLVGIGLWGLRRGFESPTTSADSLCGIAQLQGGFPHIGCGLHPNAELTHSL